MRLVRERDAVVESQDLENAVASQQSLVGDRDAGLRKGHQHAVEAGGIHSAPNLPVQGGLIAKRQSRA
jgi:hypothetical protein